MVISEAWDERRGTGERTINIFFNESRPIKSFVYTVYTVYTDLTNKRNPESGEEREGRGRGSGKDELGFPC